MVLDNILITPSLNEQLDHFSGAVREIAAMAVVESAVLAIAVCGSRGMNPARLARHAGVVGGGILPNSDLDMLVVVSDDAAQKRMQEKMAVLPCLKILSDQGRATRRVNQPPRREDVLELRTQFNPDFSHEIDVTVLTADEFQARYAGVADMFDHHADGQNIGEDELARHNLLSGFADSRIAGATAIYDPQGIFAQAQKDVSCLSGPTARALFERHWF